MYLLETWAIVTRQNYKKQNKHQLYATMQSAMAKNSIESHSNYDFIIIITLNNNSIFICSCFAISKVKDV